MNPISKAMDEIRFSIPAQILNQVFITNEMLNCGAAISIETRIREQVLDKRVLVDMDIMGGTETYISMDAPVRCEYIDPYTVIYYIPEECTQNRPIVQVYSLHFGLMGYQNAGAALSYTESPLGSEMRKVLDSAMRTPPALTSYINLIAHNVIMVRYVYLPYPNAFLRCRLGNDEALSFIRMESMPLFAELCTTAVKAYIYNNMVITMDEAYLSGGQNLGAFRDKIMEYSEADQAYRDLLKRWQKQMSCFNDAESRRRHIRTILPLV
jgi:hypothetical protein